MTKSGNGSRREEALPSIVEFFSANGVLARASGLNYEPRPAQLQMALRVDKALVERGHLVVEAGTGTGKTLGYLYPALRYSLLTGKRIILSTGTKGLQAQLFHKDVPFLKSLFGEIKVCYMKGRSNYLCRQKLYDLNPHSLNPEEREQYKVIVEWEPETGTGDRAELLNFPTKSTLWHRIDARTDACIGKKCPSHTHCFVTEMRRLAEESNIVIINHHLFFTDLAIRLKAEDAFSILPEAHAVIFDEAHELVNIASGCFGLSVSYFRIAEFIHDVRAISGASVNQVKINKAGENVKTRYQDLCAKLPGKQEVSRLEFEPQDRAAFLEANHLLYQALLSALRFIHVELGLISEEEGVPPLIQRSGEIYSQLRYLFEDPDDNSVFWIDRRPGSSPGQINTFIQATPIDVSQAMTSSIFEKYMTVVLASATLAVQDKFEHIRRSMGITEADEAIVPSVFDYQKQAILYTPPAMPDPNGPDFFDRAKDEVLQLLQISKGRAFCLFTSYEAMERMHKALVGVLPYPMLLHGSTMSAQELLAKFRVTPNAVLFGTSSFWQGIDVQGEQLSCVIIDRLPFAVPTDPVVKARTRGIEKKGGSGFFDYSVPHAIIALKQGFGRLIRSTTDRGILAILDPRINHPRYGRIFIESLPKYQMTSDIADLKNFLETPQR